MKAFRLAVPVMAVVFAIGSWVSVGTGQQPNAALPGSPLGAKGEAIYPAFEGWGPLTDGQNALQIGYFNRNKEQVVDVPIGPNNRIEPGGPDLLQPTHFEPGRHYGVFAIAVPKDFGTKKYTWTLVVNGQTSVVEFSLNPPYWIDFYKNAAKGNTPPVIKFATDGPEYSGPPTGVATSLTATVGEPLPLTLWAKDRPNTYDPEEVSPRSAHRARPRSRCGGGRRCAWAWPWRRPEFRRLGGGGSLRPDGAARRRRCRTRPWQRATARHQRDLEDAPRPLVSEIRRRRDQTVQPGQRRRGDGGQDDGDLQCRR